MDKEKEIKPTPSKPIDIPKCACKVCSKCITKTTIKYIKNEYQ